jgi:hypothetical protein
MVQRVHPKRWYSPCNKASQSNGTQYTASEQGVMNMAINTLPTDQQHKNHSEQYRQTEVYSFSLCRQHRNTTQPCAVQSNISVWHNMRMKLEMLPNPAGVRQRTTRLAMYVMSLRSHTLDVELRNIVFKQAIDTFGSSVPNRSVWSATMWRCQFIYFSLKMKTDTWKGQRKGTDVVDEDTRWYLAEIQGAFSTNKKHFCCRPPVGRGSSVGIATHLGLDGPGIESRGGGARFSAPVQTGPGAHPASYTLGTRSFPGVKRLKRGADHPPHLLPKLKKE